MTQPRLPGYQHRLAQQARMFAERHFTDPKVSIEDAAAFIDVHPRTLNKCLTEVGTSWRAILLEHRMKCGAELLETTKFMIEHVARLSGYDSAPAFAGAFRRKYTLTPSEYRRGKKGPARAGGATGAFAKGKTSTRSGVGGGADAVDKQMLHEAQERIEDRNLLEHFNPTRGASISEITDEMFRPNRLRDKPAYWHERHQALADWIDEQERRAAHSRAEDERLQAENPDDPFILFRRR